MALDAIGVATQDLTSPHTARDRVHTVVSTGDVVVVGNAPDESIEVFVISPAGALIAGDDNPVDLGEAVGRLAISD